MAGALNEGKKLGALSGCFVTLCLGPALDLDLKVLISGKGLFSFFLFIFSFVQLAI